MHDQFKPIIAGAHVEFRPSRKDIEVHSDKEPAAVMLDTGERDRIKGEISAGHVSGEARGAISWKPRGASAEAAGAFEHAQILWVVMAG